MPLADLLPVAGEVPEFVAGLVMVGLAVTVLVVRFHDRLNQAFALYLVVGGLEHVWAALDDTIAVQDLAVANLAYYRVATLFALLYLALLYRARETDRGRPRRALAGILAGALVAEAALLLTRGLPVGDDVAATADLLAYFYAWPLRLMVSGAVAVAFAREARRTTDAQRTGSLLAIAAFGLEPAYTGVPISALILTTSDPGSPPAWWPQAILWFSAAALALVAALVLWRGAREGEIDPGVGVGRVVGALATRIRREVREDLGSR